jgi:hypothetical protein
MIAKSTLGIVALPFIPSDAAMLIVQAACVATPRRLSERWRGALRRFRGPGWALIPVGSIIGVIFAIRYVSQTANWLTYLALVAVPLLAFAALGWGIRGARPWLAPIALALFLLAWRSPTTLWGEGSATLLSALSCVTLGVLLATVTPGGWLKVGIVAMSCADVWLVATDLLQTPNNVLIAAAPGGGLPQLQSEQFGTISMGYGDLFVAAVLGAVLAERWRTQWQAALLTLVLAGLFDLLFFAVSELPATVPVALALIVVEVGTRLRRRRDVDRRGDGAGERPLVRAAAGGGGGSRLLRQ